MPHIHEKIDFTVEVFIVYKNKVLLRVHPKKHEWLSVGGHIELYEDPNQAAIREVIEETGLDIELDASLRPQGLDHHGYTELIPPRYMCRHRITDAHEHVTLVYFATADTDEIRPEEEASMNVETMWCSRQDLTEMDLLPDIRFYALKALDFLGGEVDSRK